MPRKIAVEVGYSDSADVGRLVAFLLPDASRRSLSDQTFEYPPVTGVPAAPLAYPAVRGLTEGGILAALFFLLLSGALTFLLVVRHADAPA